LSRDFQTILVYFYFANIFLQMIETQHITNNTVK